LVEANPGSRAVAVHLKGTWAIFLMWSGIVRHRTGKIHRVPPISYFPAPVRGTVVLEITPVPVLAKTREAFRTPLTLAFEA
jgi:hypothetical protein